MLLINQFASNFLSSEIGKTLPDNITPLQRVLHFNDFQRWSNNCKYHNVQHNHRFIS